MNPLIIILYIISKHYFLTHNKQTEIQRSCDVTTQLCRPTSYKYSNTIQSIACVYGIAYLQTLINQYESNTFDEVLSMTIGVKTFWIWISIRMKVRPY